MNPLEPWKPSSDQPWDRPAAAHLLRRAGFAASEVELRAALRDGVEATVARLVDGDDESERFRELDELGTSLAVRDQIDGLRGWWLARMLHTRRPLAARLAVMWHNHFATSNVKVRSPAMMLQQLRTIESLALGKFGELLLSMARDPAMIAWLDGNENAKGRPNENFARELLELFSLGVGNYSEADIKQAARAFTGWHERRGQFQFASLEHDGGEKTVFGQTGRFDGGDVIRLALAQPACARFIATKLLHEFVSPRPSDELIDATAAELRASEYDVRSVLRRLLASRAMFDAAIYRARIKSPVEFVIGIARQLELRVPADKLGEVVSQLGQRLFEPPSVKGWDGHRAWLDSATMLVRLNTAARATGGEFLQARELARRYDVSDERAAILQFCGELALDGRLPDALREQVERLDGDGENLARAALRLLMSSPEYQMA